MLLLALLGCRAEAVYANFIKPPLHLKIYYLNQNASANPASHTFPKRWLEICKKWGKSFQVGQGYGSIGIFNQISCQAPNILPDLSEWSLRFVAGIDSLEIAIRKDQRVMARISLPGSSQVLDILAEDNFRELAALALMDQLPMLLPVNSQTSGTFTLLNSGLAQHEHPPLLPTNYVIYRLHYEKHLGLWKADVINSRDDVKGSSVRIGNTMVSLDEAGLWAHNHAGKGLIAQGLQQRLRSTFEEIQQQISAGEAPKEDVGIVPQPEDHHLDSTKTGRVEMQYGLSTMQDPIFQKYLTYLNILFDYYYSSVAVVQMELNMWPKVTTPLLDGNAEFEAKRFMLSSTIRLQLRNDNTSFLEFAPRVGLWQVMGRLPVTLAQGDVLLSDVDTKLAQSIGLKISHHLLWPALKISYYASYDRAFNPVKKTNINALSLSARLSPSYAQMTIKQSKIFLYIFAVSEHETITAEFANEKDISWEPLQSFTSSFVFAGLGVSTYW